MEYIARYTCLRREDNGKDGKLFILLNKDTGTVKQATHNQIRSLLKHPEVLVENLQLTSDNRVIFNTKHKLIAKVATPTHYEELNLLKAYKIIEISEWIRSILGDNALATIKSGGIKFIDKNKINSCIAEETYIKVETLNKATVKELLTDKKLYKKTVDIIYTGAGQANTIDERDTILISLPLFRVGPYEDGEVQLESSLNITYFPNRDTFKLTAMGNARYYMGMIQGLYFNTVPLGILFLDLASSQLSLKDAKNKYNTYLAYEKNRQGKEE